MRVRVRVARQRYASSALASLTGLVLKVVAETTSVRHTRQERNAPIRRLRTGVVPD